ncbi:MAG: hypothetical protein AAF961_03595 [Planctomycetota bacterium]
MFAGHDSGATAQPTHDDWSAWGDLPHDIVRHVRACDKQGLRLDLESLAEALGQPLKLVAECAESLRRLQLVRIRRSGVVVLDYGARVAH